MTWKTITPSEGARWALKHWTATSRGVATSPWKSIPSKGTSRHNAIVEVHLDEVTAEEVRALHSPGTAPVVIRGGARDWHATRTWSLDWFASHYGDHAVPTDERDSAGDTVVHPLRYCIDQTKQGNGGYARFSPLLQENPELTEYLDLKHMANLAGAPLSQLLFQVFLGGANTTTETHCAIGNNIFVQAHGEKIWRFVAPEFSAALQPVPTGRPYFASRATLHDESLHTHPNAPVHAVHLHAGDILLVPPFWWHQVDNPTESIGVAARWHHLAHAVSQSGYMSLMTLTARNPNIVRANKDRQRFGYVYQETVDQAGRPIKSAA